MDTIKLKALLKAVKYKSLSKAAEEFSYTPSAFSHMADALEQELGVKILVRTSRGITLSEDGEKLLDKFKAVVDAEEELYSAIAFLSAEKDKTLKIASYSSVAEHILPKILMGFKKENLDIKYQVSVTDNVINLLESGEVDIIFTDNSAGAGLDLTTIMEEEYVVVTKSDEFLRKKVVKKEELYAYNYIDMDDKVLEGYFDFSKFKDVIKVETHEFATVLSMIKGGLGIALVPALVVKNKHQGIKTLSLEKGVTRAVGYATKKGKKISESAKKFIKYLQKNSI